MLLIQSVANLVSKRFIISFGTMALGFSQKVELCWPCSGSSPRLSRTGVKIAAVAAKKSVTMLSYRFRHLFGLQNTVVLQCPTVLSRVTYCAGL